MARAETPDSHDQCQMAEREAINVHCERDFRLCTWIDGADSKGDPVAWHDLLIDDGIPVGDGVVAHPGRWRRK